MTLAGNLFTLQSGTVERMAKLQAVIASTPGSTQRLEQEKKELSIALALSELREVLTKHLPRPSMKTSV